MPDLIKALGDTGTGTTPTALRYLDTGQPVTALQTQLKQLGYYSGALDGSFGPATLSAVKAYQKASGLAVDGVAGPITQGSLLQASSAGGSTASPVTKPQGAVAGQITDGKVTPTTTAPDSAYPNVPQGQQGGEPYVAPGLPQKPQAGVQQYADTGGNQVVPSLSTKAPGMPQPSVPPTTVPTQVQPTVQTGTNQGTMPVQQPTGYSGGQPQQQQQGYAQPTTMGIQPTVTQGATGGSQGGTATDGFSNVTADGYQPLENPYIQQLATMQFQYDPFQDREYLKRASDYEQQIVNMMVGRGMMYSSIGSSALQSSLLELQADMTKQKYEEFRQDRDFVFQMANFISDEDQKLYGRYMDEKQFEFDVAKEAFDQAAWGAEFEFNQQKEAFNQYTWKQEFAFAKQKEATDSAIAWANYNLNKQESAFSQKMRQLEYDQQQEALKYEKLLGEAKGDLGAAKGMVQEAAVQYSREQKLFNSYYDRYKASGVADSTVAKYFGVTAGSSITSEYTIGKILGKSMELDMFRQDLYDSADIVGIDTSNITALTEWYNTRYKTGRQPLSGSSNLSDTGSSTSAPEQLPAYKGSYPGSMPSLVPGYEYPFMK